MNAPTYASCMWCGKPTGMRALDPWTVPVGCRVSLIVACAGCVAEMHPRHRLAQCLATRPDGEPPTPARPRTAGVVATSTGDGFAAVGVVDGLLVTTPHTRDRLVDVMSEASKELIQHLIDEEHACR